MWPGLKSPRENSAHQPGPAQAELLPHRQRALGAPTCPHFLWRLVALIYPMRLSSMKGAHADLSSTVRQEIGVKPAVACPALPRRTIGGVSWG